MERLTGKNALVFGGDAISRAIAARYLEEGAHVTLMAEAAALDGIAPHAALRTLAQPADADGLTAAVRAAVGTSLDILVIGGADIPPEAEWRPVAALSLAQFRATQDRMVGSALGVLQACEAALKAPGEAAIIFLCSPAGLYAEGGWSDYTIAYHAREGLMRAVGTEWGKWNVRANMLVPLADTPGFRAFRERDPAQVDFRITKLPMRRMGDPVRDIGGAAVFLGSSDTRFLTGMVVNADGGGHLVFPITETRMEHAS